MHLDRLGKADRLTHQTFDPSAQRQVLTLDFLRVARKSLRLPPLLCGGGDERREQGLDAPAPESLRVLLWAMVLRRTPHAVYDTLYHLVWSVKYRRDGLQGDIQRRVEELFGDIAEQYDITIEEMEVSPDHVHIFCSFPPRYSIAQVVTRFKSLGHPPKAGQLVVDHVL